MSSSPNVVPARFRFGRNPDIAIGQSSVIHADELMLRRWYRHHDRRGDLTRSELALLVEDLSAHPELWRHLLHRSPDERHYVQMFLDAHVEIWLICWCPTLETGFHDHGGSRGAVAVVQGMLTETLPNIGLYVGATVLAIFAPNAAAGFYLVIALVTVARARGDSPAPEPSRVA